MKVEAGKTYTQAALFTHTKSATWTQAGLCGELTVASGDSAAWVTWAAGEATIVVPATAKAGTEVVTLTRSYPTGGAGGTNTSASTATGAMKLTLTVAAGAGGAAGGTSGVADVAGTAAAVVAGVLGGTVFAAAFLPSPPTPSAPTAAGGAAPAQE